MFLWSENRLIESNNWKSTKLNQHIKIVSQGVRTICGLRLHPNVSPRVILKCRLLSFVIWSHTIYKSTVFLLSLPISLIFLSHNISLFMNLSLFSFLTGCLRYHNTIKITIFNAIVLSWCCFYVSVVRVNIIFEYIIRYLRSLLDKYIWI